MKTPNSIRSLADSLAKLPGIGPRQAFRIAYFLAGKGKDQVLPMAKNLAEITKLKTCQKCFSSYEEDSELCPICSDKRRNHGIVAIVEKETDVASIESAGSYDGIYFVIGEIKKTGSLNPDERKRLETFKDNLRKDYPEGSDEIIIGFNNTTYGDIGRSLIIRELQPYAKKITSLGRGIPTGGEVEFADPETLAEALKGRN